LALVTYTKRRGFFDYFPILKVKNLGLAGFSRLLPPQETSLTTHFSSIDYSGGLKVERRMLKPAGINGCPMWPLSVDS
jgi:hypothetical protein